MSQDNPNPESSTNRERRNQRQPSPKIEQPTQQPIWKQATVSFLRGTIGILENTVEKLETQTIDGRESNKKGFWKNFLTKVRQVVPGGLAARLTDPALTTIIVGIAIAFVWTGNNLWHQQNQEVAEPSPEIAINQEIKAPETATEITNAPTANIPEELDNPPTTIPVEASPETTIPQATIEPIIQPTAAPSPQTAAEDKVISEKLATEIEPEVKSEVPAEITPEIETTPIPEIEQITQAQDSLPEYIALTPEQNLIAAIENRIAEISDRIAMGIVQSTQANFANSTLSVTISDEWYSLKAKQQNEIATEIWQNSQNLDFTHLEIVDTQKRLVARNPVVGTQVIILQRHT